MNLGLLAEVAVELLSRLKFSWPRSHTVTAMRESITHTMEVDQLMVGRGSLYDLSITNKYPKIAYLLWTYIECMGSLFVQVVACQCQVESY